MSLKPLSVTTNVVGLQTDDADHVDQNSSAHVARVVGSQTDAVVATETHFTFDAFSPSRVSNPFENLLQFSCNFGQDFTFAGKHCKISTNYKSKVSKKSINR